MSSTIAHSNGHHKNGNANDHSEAPAALVAVNNGKVAKVAKLSSDAKTTTTAASAKTAKQADMVSFLQSVFDMSVTEGYLKPLNKEVPVVRFEKPEELEKKIALDVADKPVGHEKLLDMCKTVFDYSVKTGRSTLLLLFFVCCCWCCCCFLR